MKPKFVVSVMIAAILALALSGAGRQSADQLYKSGLYEEEVGGDLQKAIGIYQDLLKRFPDSRGIAAMAQLHIGLCHQKLGTKEAEKAFQKVIDNYPEQSEAVREAKAKLSLLLGSRTLTKAGDAEFKLRQVWAGPGVDTEGSVTLDGRYLSFVDWETGDLAVRDLASGTNRRLTNKGTWEQSPEFAMLSIWSRDGRRIAYQWYGKDDVLELRVYDTKDGSIRTIQRSKSANDWAQACAWSPDGRSVLVVYYLEATATKGRETRLAFISVEDGSMKSLRGHFETLTALSNSPNGFTLSADGSFIAYDAPPSDEDTGNRDIYLISLRDGTEQRLVEHPVNDEVISWTPDGRGLLFASDRMGTTDLWLQTVSEGIAQGAPRLLKSGIGIIGPMGITSRGDLYYGAGGSPHDIYVVDLESVSRGGRAAVKKLALPFQGQNYFPDYSPDGKQIAYLSMPRGRGQVIGLVSPETGQVKDLALRGSDNTSPRWIPPGSRTLSFLSTDKEGRKVVFKVDIQTGEAAPVGPPIDRNFSWSDRPAWSRDGKKMFFAAGIRSEQGGYVHVFDLETGKCERLTGSPDDVHYLAISPDGKWLALLNSQGRRVLRIMPASGGEPRAVHSFEHKDGTLITPAWSADGRSIYFPKLRDPEKNIFDLFRVSRDGGEAEKIELGLYWIRFLTMSPDGRSVAFSSLGADPEPYQVWVMENFLPAGKK